MASSCSNTTSNENGTANESFDNDRAYKRRLSEDSFENKRKRVENEVEATEDKVEPAAQPVADVEIEAEEEEEDEAMDIPADAPRTPPMSPERPATPPMEHLLNAPRKLAIRRLYNRLERIPMRPLTDLTDTVVFTVL